MCLPDFERFDNISKENPLVGYRNWRLPVKDTTILISENQNYKWDNVIVGPHQVLDTNSGIYAYNNYYNYYNNNNNYYYYYVAGIIEQYGRVAIHKIGQRSEYAKISTLFTIRELDARGTKCSISWIHEFNLIIIELAKKYECNTIHYQDFKENNVLDLSKL